MPSPASPRRRRSLLNGAHRPRRDYAGLASTPAQGLHVGRPQIAAVRDGRAQRLEYAVPKLVCANLHQPDGWLSPGTLTLDDDGFITDVQPGSVDGPATHIAGFTLPGMSNLHSHAFQRALAGFTQTGEPDHRDSFWTWRDRMYRLALLVTPEQLQAIAAQLYVEMMEAGFTAVGEFHYLHHAPDGAPYGDAEMGGAIAEAARRVGIALTLLPTAYMGGGFGRVAESHQRRFVHRSADDFLVTWESSRAIVREAPYGVLGVAPHSLRAVPAEALQAIVVHVHRTNPAAPVHIHIAEQPQEVEECLVARGARPVEWLLDHLPVDDRWCLVHATHVTDEELKRMAACTVVGLCPTTEADLGDGTFDAERYLGHQGRWGIGSDSHTDVSVARELSLLEWGQRLRLGRRNVLLGPSRSVGRTLYDAAAGGGATALGQPIGALTPGRRADLTVLDAAHPRLVGHGPETAIDGWLFSGASDVVDQVWVAGRRIVDGGVHRSRAPVRRAFARALRQLGPQLTD